MAAQLGLALDNLKTVLAAADMTMASVVRLTVFTTDMASCLSTGRASRAGSTAALRPASSA